MAYLKRYVATYSRDSGLERKLSLRVLIAACCEADVGVDASEKDGDPEEEVEADIM